MMEMMAKETARKVCAVLKEDSKKVICIELLTKILTYGDSVKDEVREEIRKTFTEDERKLLKQEMAKLLE
jgi:hypothetical protein